MMLHVILVQYASSAARNSCSVCKQCTMKFLRSFARLSMVVCLLAATFSLSIPVDGIGMQQTHFLSSFLPSFPVWFSLSLPASRVSCLRFLSGSLSLSVFFDGSVIKGLSQLISRRWPHQTSIFCSSQKIDWFLWPIAFFRIPPLLGGQCLWSHYDIFLLVACQSRFLWCFPCMLLERWESTCFLRVTLFCNVFAYPRCLFPFPRISPHTVYVLMHGLVCIDKCVCIVCVNNWIFEVCSLKIFAPSRELQREWQRRWHTASCALIKECCQISVRLQITIEGSFRLH